MRRLTLGSLNFVARKGAKVLLVLLIFSASLAHSRSSRVFGEKTLSQVVSYREWKNLLLWSLGADPALKKIWKESEGRFSKAKARKIFLMGGGLRGRMNWLEAQLLQGKTPTQIRRGRVPKFYSQLRQAADIDVLDAGGIGSELGALVEGALKVDLTIEIVAKSAYENYVKMEGATLDTLAANPWALSDPLGALRDYWRGRIRFLYNQRSARATDYMHEEGFSALGQALRFMRHRAENPKKKIHASSWQAIERALKAERGLLNLARQSFMRESLLFKYSIEKRLNKILHAYEGDLGRSLMELRTHKFLSSLAEGPFRIEIPSGQDLAQLYRRLRKAGFSSADMIRVRRILAFSDYGQWKIYQDLLVLDFGMRALKIEAGIDDLGFFFPYLQEEIRKASSFAAQIQSAAGNLCADSIRHIKEYPIFSASSINGAAAGQVHQEKSLGPLSRTLDLLKDLSGYLKSQGLEDSCRDRVLQELEQKLADEVLPRGTPVILTLFLGYLGPLPEKYAARIQKIDRSFLSDRFVREELSRLEKEALSSSELLEFKPIVERFFAWIDAHPQMTYEEFLSFSQTEDAEALRTFSQISGHPVVAAFHRGLDERLRRLMQAGALNEFVFYHLMSLHKGAPLPEDLSAWVLEEAKKFSPSYKDEDWQRPGVTFLDGLFQCFPSNHFSRESRAYFTYLKREMAAGKKFEVWQRAFWDIHKQADPQTIQVITELIQGEVEKGPRGDLYAIERWIVFVAKNTNSRVRVPLASYLELALASDQNEGKNVDDFESDESRFSYWARDIVQELKNLVVKDEGDPLNATLGGLSLSELKKSEAVKETLERLDIGWKQLERMILAVKAGGRLEGCEKPLGASKGAE